MFKNAKVGNKVWDFTIGWGKIVDIDTDIDRDYPITVQFDCGVSNSYTLSGKYHRTDNRPRLFWDEIKFKIPEIPKDPFSLEESLRKLKIQQFKKNKFNGYLIWNHFDDKIDCIYMEEKEILGAIPFTKASINKFIKKIQHKKISKEEFLNTYKTVFK